MSQQINARVAVVGIDIGKNSFHIVGGRPRRDCSAAKHAPVTSGLPR